MRWPRALALGSALCFVSTLAFLHRGVDMRAHGDTKRARPLEKYDAQMRDLLVHYF